MQLQENLQNIYISPITTKENLINLLAKEELYKEMVWNKDELLEQIDFEMEKSLFFEAIIDGEVAGFFCFQNIQPNAFIGHMGFYKKFRGFQAYACGMRMLEFLENCLEHCTLYAYCPQSRPKAARYAIKLGFEFIGVLPNSICIDGTFEHQGLYQLNL